MLRITEYILITLGTETKKKHNKMFVPGHVVSMYVATGGASGLSLGSDEKEIILLVFAIIDAVANKVSSN